MSETKESDNKTAAGRKTMSLNVKRTVEQGHIRQNFSHGRSKSVLVETKRKRHGLAHGLTEEPQHKAEPVPAKPEHRAFQKPQSEHPRGEKRPQKVLRELSAGEMDARARALIEARKREDVERREREIEETRLREEAKKREAEEQQRRAEEEAQRKVTEEAERLRAAEAEAAAKTQKQDEVPRPAEPPRRVGPDSFRMIAPQAAERRTPPATLRPGQRENQPAPGVRDAQRGAGDAQRTPSREGAGREAPRAREGFRSEGARPGSAPRPAGAAGGAARPAFGARPGAPSQSQNKWRRQRSTAGKSLCAIPAELPRRSRS